MKYARSVHPAPTVKIEKEAFLIVPESLRDRAAYPFGIAVEEFHIGVPSEYLRYKRERLALADKIAVEVDRQTIAFLPISGALMLIVHSAVYR